MLTKLKEPPSTAFLHLEGDAPSKREILRHALHLFVRDGLCETSIRDIARASGFTNPALYKFFESKEAVALHLFERCYLRIVSAVRGSQKRQDFATDLGALVEVCARLIDENLEAVLFVNDTLRHFWPKVSRGVRQHSLVGELRALIQLGKQTRAVPGALDGDLAVAMVLGTMGQIARMAYFDEIERPLTARLPELRLLFRRTLQEKPS